MNQGSKVTYKGSEGVVLSVDADSALVMFTQVKPGVSRPKVFGVLDSKTRKRKNVTQQVPVDRVHEVSTKRVPVSDLLPAS